MLFCCDDAVEEVEVLVPVLDMLARRRRLARRILSSLCKELSPTLRCCDDASVETEEGRLVLLDVLGMLARRCAGWRILSNKGR